MKSYREQIENLQKEIKGAIIELLGKHGLTELHFPNPEDCDDAPDSIYVIFYDDYGDPYECVVNSVCVEDMYISLTSTERNDGGKFLTESSVDMAICNPIWLNEIYEAAQVLLEGKRNNVEP